MVPTLKPDQLVVLRRQKLRVGDVVIVLHDHMEKVKRITALTAHTVFVEGDNPASSTDSRHFGWVDRDSIKGVVVWPKVTKSRLYQK